MYMDIHSPLSPRLIYLMWLPRGDRLFSTRPEIFALEICDWQIAIVRALYKP